MTIINDIRACLDDHLTNTANIPVIARQNVPYEHVVGTPFLKANLVPTSVRPATAGLQPQQRYQGLYSVLICTPEGNGPGQGYDYADTLLARFPPGTNITFNGLTISVAYSEVGNSFLDSPFYCTPVTVSWYVYNQ